MHDQNDGAFDRLQLERKRTMFMLYGALNVDGAKNGPYIKQAHSLREAVADMEGNAGVQDGPYLVRDAFIEEDGEGGTLHVELATTVDPEDGSEA